MFILAAFSKSVFVVSLSNWKPPLYTLPLSVCVSLSLSLFLSRHLYTPSFTDTLPFVIVAFTQKFLARGLPKRETPLERKTIVNYARVSLKLFKQNNGWPRLMDKFHRQRNREEQISVRKFYGTFDGIDKLKSPENDKFLRGFGRISIREVRKIRYGHVALNIP